MKAQPPRYTSADSSQNTVDPVKLAVVWVRKAKGGSVQWLDQSVGHQCTEEQFWYYSVSKRLKPLGITTKYALVLLTLFDPPAKCRGTPENCAKLDPQVYSVQFPIIATRVSMVIAISLYLIIGFRMTLRRWAMGQAYRFHGWHMFTTIFVTIGLISSAITFFAPGALVLSVICRPLVFLGVSKSLRTGVIEILCSLPGFFDVLVSFCICVAIFVWMGMVLFPGTPEGEIDFYSWGDGFAKLWTGYTTANSPNFYIPALNQDRWYFVFFFVYMVLTLFLLSNVLLAKVYDAYKDSLKDKYTTIQENQIVSMQRAHTQLADEATKRISVETWKKFFAEYCDPYMGGITVGNPEDKEYNLFRINIILKLFHGIDVERSDGLNIEQWKKVLSIFFDRDIYIPTKRPPRVSSSGDVLFNLQNFFSSGMVIGGITVQWDSFMDFVILIGTILTFVISRYFAAAKTTPNLLHTTTFWFLFCFSLFYFIGLNTKIFCIGIERFWHRKPLQHRFDFANVYALLAIEVLYMTLWHTEGMARAVILLHMCRTLRLFVYIGPLQQLFIIVRQLIPTFWQVLMILLIVYYIFAVMGQWCFGGLIYTSNPALAGTGFAQGLYWSLTFNDLVSGMVTLFLTMLVNNWYIVADGYMLTSGTIWCGIYFFAWYVVANFVMINIVVAVILDGTGVVSAQQDKAQGKKGGDMHRVTSAELLQSAAGDHSAAFMMRQILEEEDHAFGVKAKDASSDSGASAVSEGSPSRARKTKHKSVS